MKSWIIIGMLLMAAIASKAQPADKGPGYKQYTGRCGANPVTCLFEDDTFIQYGYTTAVWGSYGFGKDMRFANKHNNLFVPGLAAYDYDKSSVQHIRKLATDNESDFHNNTYNDDRYFRKYVKCQPQTRTAAEFSKEGIAGKSIFFSVCGADAGASDHYNSTAEHGYTYESSEPDTGVAVPAPETEDSLTADSVFTKEYDQNGVHITEDYQQGTLIRSEHWHINESKSTVQYYVNGKPGTREEITNRYSLAEEIIETFDPEGNLTRRKVASLVNGNLVYHIYDGKGKLIKEEGTDAGNGEQERK